MKEVKKTKQYEQILSRTFLFRGIGEATVGEVYASQQCTCAQFEQDEKIYTRTDFRRSVGVVLSGCLKAVKAGTDGPAVILNTFRSGGIFGVAGLFNSSDRYVSEIVAMRRSRILFLPQPLLRDLFYRKPHVAENYIAFLSDRIRYLNTCIDHFTGGSAEARLAEFLLTLSEGGALMLELPCSLTQLAGTLGIGRASLYRAFGSLAETGLIRRDGRRVEILDADGLKGGRF